MTAMRDERPATAEAFLARRQARRITTLEGALREALELLASAVDDPTDSQQADLERLHKALV